MKFSEMIQSELFTAQTWHDLIHDAWSMENQSLRKTVPRLLRLVQNKGGDMVKTRSVFSLHGANVYRLIESGV